MLILNGISSSKKKGKNESVKITLNIRIVIISVNTKVSIGLCLSSMGVVFHQKYTSRLFKNKLSLSIKKKKEKKASALSFVYFNSWPVILTALPAVMVASRRCETRS